MGDPITVAAIGAGSSLLGGAAEGRSQKKMAKAQRQAEERLFRLQVQAEKDMEREKWIRERELWQKAMGAYSGFSKAPTLVGKSQMHTPYTQIDSPGTVYNPSSPSGA